MPATDLAEVTQEWHLGGFGGTQGSGGLLLLAVHGAQQSLRPFWRSEPRKGGHSRAQGGLCGGLGHAGPGPRAALEPFPAFLASLWKEVVGGEGKRRDMLSFRIETSLSTVSLPF